MSITQEHATDQDTINKYKELVWRVYDTTFNRKNPAGARDCYAADYRCHTPLHPDGVVDRDGIEGDGDLVLSAVPDVTVAFADAFGQGDRLVVRHVFHGTHTGSLLGIPPSGRTVTISGTDIYRFEDGKIAEEWAQPDLFGLLQQIGALPPPPPGAP
jgi:predicted SnoaL-like aldol condensation-catalyzing enzyme